MNGGRTQGMGRGRGRGWGPGASGSASPALEWNQEVEELNFKLQKQFKVCHPLHISGLE